MREKMLGRWMVRLAVTIGAGSVALGLSGAAYAQDVSFGSGLASLSSSSTVVGVAQVAAAQPEHIYITEDFVWG